MTAARPRLRVLHCSDFHFDARFREDAINVVRRLAAMQHTLEADVVLMAGDVFDSTRQPAQFVADVAEAMLGFRVPIIAIPGNHDVVYDHRDPTSQLFSLVKETCIYLSSAEGQTIVDASGRLRVWGRGMPEHSPTNNPLESFEPMEIDGLWNIVLAHGELMSLRDTSMLSSPIILENYDAALDTIHYAALGHHHYPSETTHGHTLIRYSGSPSYLVGPGTVTLVNLSSEEGVAAYPYPVQG